jgi:iron complex transport system substrate-binding protein
VAELSTVLDKSTEVLSLTPNYLCDVLEDIRRVGRAAGVERRAGSLTAELQARIEAVSRRAGAAARQPRVLQLEWADPLLCGGHWVVEMVELAGGVPCFGSKDAGSSRLDLEGIIKSQPEIILFMPCGFGLERALEDVPLLTALPGWDSLPAVAAGKVYVLDAGAYTSRLGPRLITGLEIMAEIIHPELFAGLTPPGSVVRLNS